MTVIKDVHTHKQAPQPQSIISVSPNELPEIPNGQLYSLALHPWQSSAEDAFATVDEIMRLSSRQDVAAIGECGIDLIHGAPLFRQITLLRRCIEISECVGKPLILHSVKSHDIIVGLRRELRPQQLWIFHGFRLRPSIMRLLADVGIMLSFGEKFNPDSLSECPAELLLAESDESQLNIDEILSLHAAVRSEAPSFAIANAADIFRNVSYH